MNGWVKTAQGRALNLRYVRTIRTDRTVPGQAVALVAICDNGDLVPLDGDYAGEADARRALDGIIER